jgi:hypothetical protein
MPGQISRGKNKNVNGPTEAIFREEGSGLKTLKQNDPPLFIHPVAQHVQGPLKQKMFIRATEGFHNLPEENNPRMCFHNADPM